MAWTPRKCVVVPVDFSPASDIAIRTALATVEDPRHVHVIHVVTIPEFIPYGEFVWVVEPEEWKAKAAQHLVQYLSSHKEFRSVSSATVNGEPDSEIVKYAKDRHADLIIMPSHGYRGIKRLVMGSVTQGVLKHAPCDVLVQRFPDAERS